MKSIVFGFFVIIICGVAALAGRLQVDAWVQQAKTLTARQEQISKRQLELGNLREALLDLETAERGYLITGDDTYLAPYQGDRAEFAAALSQLTAAAGGEPELPALIGRIGALGRRREEQLDRTIALRREGGFAAALARVETREGKRTMDEFREQVQLLALRLDGLRTLAAQRELALYRNLSRLDAVIVALILLLVSVAVGVLALSVRHLNELQKQREREAMHDALTKLPNRRYLSEWLTLAVAAARRTGHALTILYLDLDRFKTVNDRFGHAAGDRALRAAALRLQRGMRASDFVARLGGDEFVAVLPTPPPAADLSALVARLQQALTEPLIPELEAGAVSASIGVASFPADGDTPDALLAAGDRAMYAVKEQHRAQRAAPTARDQPQPLPA